MSGWYRKVRDRLRYGSAIQELLYRSARAGVTVYPYCVTEESTRTVGAPQENPPDIKVDEIFAADAHLLAQVDLKHLSLEKANLRFSRGHRCFGVWQREQLAGFAWYRFDHCIGIVHNAPLFALAADEAHAYHVYVAKVFRDQELAMPLRRQVCRLLDREGIRAVFSISMYFEGSPRRAHEKLGAVTREARVLFGIGRRWYRDLRLKNYGVQLPTARIFEPVRLPQARASEVRSR